jgi:uncharacterized integral membrane protein
MQMKHNMYDTGSLILILILIYLLTAIGLTRGGSSTVHIYTQTIHRTTQLTTLVGNEIYETIIHHSNVARCYYNSFLNAEYTLVTY